MGKRETDGLHRPYSPKPFPVIYVGLVVLGGILAAAAYVGILRIQSLSILGTVFDEKQAQARLEALKVALTTVAGLAAAAGLYVGYRKQRVEETNSSREQDRVFTERFSSAAALLASDNAAVRLAGVQAFARLADDSPRDRYTCLSALCSYLRLPVRLVESPDPSEEVDPRRRVAHREQWLDPDEWDVRRTGLRLLLARLAIQTGHPWDLRDSVLIEPDFAEGLIAAGIDASRSALVGDIHIASAVFRDISQFNGCYFSGSLNVTGASAVLTFDESTVDGRFRFRLTADFARDPSWGLLPTFERCTFAGGGEFLADLSEFVAYSDPSNRLQKAVWALFYDGLSPFPRFDASTVTLKLLDSSFAGAVLLSSAAVDVRGADFSRVKSFQIAVYDASAEVAPLFWDATTRWPDGVDHRRLFDPGLSKVYFGREEP